MNDFFALLTGRRSWTALIAAVPVMLLTSCSGVDEPAASPTPSPGPPAAVSEPDGPISSPAAEADSPPVLPVFSVASIDGEDLRLEDVLGTAPVYVLFIPGADGELDRAQVGQIQGRYPEFEALGAHIFLIASDLPTEVVKMRDEFGLEFPLIADPLRVIAADWHVFDLFGEGRSGPASFVFGAHGSLIARLIAAEPGDRPSVDEVLGVIEESLSAGGV